LIFLLAFSAGELIVRRKKTFGVVLVLEAEKDELEFVVSFLLFHKVHKYRVPLPTTGEKA
jgi:hypothetical protein